MLEYTGSIKKAKCTKKVRNESKSLDLTTSLPFRRILCGFLYLLKQSWVFSLLFLIRKKIDVLSHFKSAATALRILWKDLNKETYRLQQNFNEDRNKMYIRIFSCFSWFHQPPINDKVRLQKNAVLSSSHKRNCVTYPTFNTFRWKWKLSI